MLNIALTGGIGSGKSTVAGMLVDLGAELIDADLLAREVVEPGTPTLSLIAEEFGPSVLARDGSLDRPALAEIVFGDEEAREALNSIIHPAIRIASKARREHILLVDPRAIIVEDIPLLAESRQEGRFHAVIVVHTPLDLRLDRLEGRGMVREEARARIASQARDEERLAIADAVLRNDGALDHLEWQVRELWEQRLLPYRDALGSPALHERPRRAPTAAEAGRAVGRIRAALGGPGVEVLLDGHLRLRGADQAELPSRLRAAGFVPLLGAEGTYASADPDNPLLLHLEESV